MPAPVRIVRRRVRRLTAILAFVAIVLSGGVARFAHLAIAHGGDSCRSHADGAGHGSLLDFSGRSLVRKIACSHAHGLEHRSGDGSEHGSATGTRSCDTDSNPPGSSRSTHGEDCATCAELAANLLRPQVPLTLDPTLALLAIRSAAPAASAPALAVLRSIAARPPPAVV